MSVLRHVPAFLQQKFNKIDINQGSRELAIQKNKHKQSILILFKIHGITYNNNKSLIIIIIIICLAVTFRSTFPHEKYKILEKYMVEGN